MLFGSWQFNLTMVLILGVTFNQFFKLAVKDIPKESISTIIMQIIAGTSLLTAVLFFDFKWPSSPKVYILLLAASTIYALTDRLQVTVRKNLEVSVYSILDQLTKVLIVIYGILIYKEEIIASKLIGRGLILLGNILIFYKKGRFKFNRYAWLSFFVSLLVATGMLIDVGVSEQFNFSFYLMLTFIVPAIFLYLARRFPLKEMQEEFSSLSKILYSHWNFLGFFCILYDSSASSG